MYCTHTDAVEEGREEKKRPNMFLKKSLDLLIKK